MYKQLSIHTAGCLLNLEEKKSALYCDNEATDQPVMKQITDTSVDKAEVLLISILIYVFIYKNRHMLLKA